MTNDAPSRLAYEQLSHVVMLYPLWPGDTLAHSLANECFQRGWIRRDEDGNWIPTEAGIRAHENGPFAGGAK